MTIIKKGKRISSQEGRPIISQLRDSQLGLKLEIKGSLNLTISQDNQGSNANHANRVNKDVNVKAEISSVTLVFKDIREETKSDVVTVLT